MPSGSLGNGAYRDFGSFLDSLEQSESGSDRRFIGRNFRLDERVPDERVSAYADVAEAPLSDITDWYLAHRDYSATALQVEQPPSGLPRKIDPSDPSTCAESFRFNGSLASVDPSLELIRVERLAPIAEAAGVSEAETVKQFSAAASPEGDPASKKWANAVLGRWSRTRDLRPCWASFWADCADILDASTMSDEWASELAGRLGLAHFGPALRGRPVHIVVFRYPVRSVPTRSGLSKDRALAFPTVLDGELSEAFCPAPSESTWGRAVDLSANGSGPCRELIHPPMRLRDEHLEQVGVLEPHTRGPLSEARGVHIVWLQVEFDRSDFGDATDADLLA